MDATAAAITGARRTRCRVRDQRRRVSALHAADLLLRFFIKGISL
jgi:hypothetical protein